MQYLENITFTVGFVSLIFLGSYYWVFVFNFLQRKIQNNIVESLFCIPGASAEPQVNSRVNLIVVSDIGLLL